jgi:hypothetical protein
MDHIDRDGGASVAWAIAVPILAKWLRRNEPTPSYRVYLARLAMAQARRERGDS